MKKNQQLYFVNAWVDGSIMGIVSILVYFFCHFFYTSSRTMLVIYLASALSWIINWPHFSATSYRLFQDKEHIHQFKLTSFLIPLIVGLGAFASFAYPDVFAPYYVKVFTIWSPFHFCGQTMGITLIYARRANFQIQKWNRIALFIFIYGTFLFQSSMAETYTQGSDFYSIHSPGLGVPIWMPIICKYLMYIAGVVFLFLSFKQARLQKIVIPWIVFLPMTAQFFWFVLGNGTRSFQEFVPLFHSVQYLLIAWSMEMHTQVSKENNIPSFSRFLLKKSAVWGAANIFGGALLFFIMPLILVKFGWSYGVSAAIILSAVQIHHFFVDGVIWKLKSKSNLTPLMANIFDQSNNMAKMLDSEKLRNG